MKCCAALFVAALLPIIPAQAQESPTKGLELAKEPHHTLLFQNSEVRVFHLNLKPGEVTLPHRHETFYAFFSLSPVAIGNEVRGHQPVLTRLDSNELHTSKGGFTVAERNNSSKPAELLVIEAAKVESEGFSAPMGGFRYHSSAYSALFESPTMRAYSMILFDGGLTDPHTETYGGLFLAVSDLKLLEMGPDGTSSQWEMKAGETRWVPRGVTHALANLGPSNATFIVLELN